MRNNMMSIALMAGVAIMAGAWFFSRRSGAALPDSPARVVTPAPAAPTPRGGFTSDDYIT